MIPAAVFSFVLVALYVAGVRALATLEEHAARQERQPCPTPYSGPFFNTHGREVTSAPDSCHAV